MRYLAASLVLLLAACSRGGTVHEPDPDTTINPSITAAMIEGNPVKYVGQRVRLHCTVGNVMPSGAANVECGMTMADLMQPTTTDPSKIAATVQKRSQDYTESHGSLVLEGEDRTINQLDANQRILVEGFVDDPMKGKTTLGVDSTFPVVYAEKISPDN